MLTLAILALVTLLYSGYNLFIKISGEHIPAQATTTILATLALQASAMLVSLVFVVTLSVRGGHHFALSGKAYVWAIVAGLCIGAAEIGYFYLFGGSSINGIRALPANVVIPTVVGGTVALTLAASVWFLREPVFWNHWLGALLIIAGVLLIFVRSGTT